MDSQEQYPLRDAASRRWLRIVLAGLGGRVKTPQTSARAVILCYHSVHPTASFRSATPDLFSQHLVWLKQNCRVVQFQQAIRAAEQPYGGRPVVAITFDDGFADNYEYAFPLLRQHKLTATFFLTVGLLEKNPIVLERLRDLWGARAEEIRPLTWSAVREMQRAGMELGAHTYSHPNLARLDRRSAELEARRSKEIIEYRLGASVRLMAYPLGKPRCHFTKDTVDVVSSAGYEYAAAVTWRGIRASDSQFRIPRFTCTGDSITTLRDKVLGVWDLLGVWQERAPLGMPRPANGPPPWWMDAMQNLRAAEGSLGCAAVHRSNMDTDHTERSPLYR